METGVSGGEKRMNLRMNTVEKAGELVFYGLGLLLLWEWLRPLEQLTGTGYLSVFVVFIALSFLLQFLQTRPIYRLLLLVSYVLWSTHFLYYKKISLFDWNWLQLLIGSFTESIGFLMSKNWVEISYEFRTILFFILLWLMTYLLHYWIVVKKSIFLFFLVTVLFITILDTFSPYDGNAAIVRLVIFGFFMLGCLHFFRLLQKEKIKVDKRLFSKWTIPLLGFIVFATLFGFSAPKFDPQWPDPVPYIISYSEKFTEEEPAKRAGFGEDDSRLGGDFLEDDTVVLTVKTNAKHYWKIESKDVYTGKGWERNLIEGNVTTFDSGADVQLLGYGKNIKSVEHVAYVYVKLFYNHIPYPEPLWLKRIITDTPTITFKYEESKDRIHYESPYQSSPPLRNYTIHYYQPVFNIDELKKVQSADQFGLTPLFMARYTQLPDTLPGRVRILAAELTEGKTNWYDKAKAIENHFDNIDFVYQKENIPYPEENEDYVDQFLFETHRGYCDNFSSSMVVLLRAAGIPARWVKGYSNGEFIEKVDGISVYDITNSNAHSWVEVFFPNVGWVPFEPTKGFTNHARFETNLKLSETSDTLTPEIKPKQEKSQQEEKKSSTASDQKGTLKERVEKGIQFIKTYWWEFVGILVGICLLIYVLYKVRGKWLPRFWMIYFRRNKKEHAFYQAYGVLLKELNRYGLKRYPDQTLSDYANYIDTYFMTNDMKKLTKKYEAVLYGGREAEKEWMEVYELWENLIKKTIS